MGWYITYYFRLTDKLIVSWFTSSLYTKHWFLHVLGLGLFTFQVFLYPSAERLLGPAQLNHLAGELMIPVQLSYPFIAHLSGVSRSILLSFAYILVNVFSVSHFLSFFIAHVNTLLWHIWFLRVGLCHNRHGDSAKQSRGMILHLFQFCFN